MYTVVITVHNFSSIVQKSMIFFLVKDIDEWNILSLRNDIIVKKNQPRSGKISCGIKSLFPNSVDKKLKIFIFKF